MVVKWKPSSPPSPWCDYRAEVCGSLLTVKPSDWSNGDLGFDDLENIVWGLYRFCVMVGLKAVMISRCSYFCFINNTLENKVDIVDLLWLKTPC